MEIFKLFGSILVDNDKANESISKTDKKAKGLGDRFLSGAKTVAKWGAAAGGAAAAAGAAMFAMATKAGDAADRLLDLKAITGMSTDEIQKWEKVTKVAGVSIDSMTNASQKFTKSLDTMSTEGHKGNEALQAMGLSLSEIESMSADERMNTLTTALSEVEDRTERARLGTDLFGGSWKEIAPVVDMGAEAMQKAKDSANVISEDDLNKANNFRISVAELKDQFGHFFMMLSINVIPIMQRFMDWVMQHMPAIQETMNVVFEAITQAVGNVIEWVKQFIQWLQTLKDENEGKLNEMKELFMSVFDSIINLVQGFITMFTTFWNAYGENIVTILKAAISLIITTFKTTFTLIKDIFNVFAALFRGDWKGLWEAVKTLVKNLWDNIGGIIEKALDLILKVVKTVMTMVVDTIKNLWNGAVNFLKSIDLFSIGKNIIQGLINGIKSMVSAVGSTVKNIASSVTDGFKNFLGIRSPSRVMKDQVGKPIVEGVEEGIEEEEESLFGKVGNMARSLVPKVPKSNLQFAGTPINYITNITVEGNIDRDLYDDIMRQQKNDVDNRLRVLGVRG